MANQSIHEQFLNWLGEFRKANPSLEVPPKSFTEMKAEVLSFVKDQSLTVRFPFDPRFTNPMGVFQGGMLCTAVDNVFGPLSYFVAGGPCVTLDLSCRYIRPFLPKDQFVTIEARVVSRTKQLLVMQADLKNSEGKLVAVASTQFLILS